MTWAGWSPDSARAGTYSTSVFGLTRSLPLFLSQYERDDFPFDAVLLFGLHNDEIPMRHWGDADVIDMWNREYAYPKVIPATQRDFFTHITTKFGNQIKTYRGDGGSYWEDEAGADARIAAMIRTSQTQLAAAEKFESIATWLQPHLNFDRQPFDAAWKNILLADSYVWSDANSFKRPESYRTRGGEAAHRAWAEAALQQTSDLRLVAMDKIAELVGTDQQGAVVFNPESWPRSDFFDFELEPDEALTDPATGQTIPCGALRLLNGYQEVRCWAADVPAVGYKFYAITKGKVSEGEVLALDPSKPTIENKYYKVELNSQTGAVAHLLDKSTGQDLVNSGSGYQLNEYVYVSGGDPSGSSSTNNRILAADITLPLPKLTVNRASLTASPQARRFPWGTVITIRSKALNTPEIISTITLLDTRKQVNIHNEVEKTATLKKEGIYFAFPFTLKQPQDEISERDRLGRSRKTRCCPAPTVNGSPPRAASGEKDTGRQYCLGHSRRPTDHSRRHQSRSLAESLQIRNGSVFSYVMNNYWYTDAPATTGRPLHLPLCVDQRAGRVPSSSSDTCQRTTVTISGNSSLQHGMGTVHYPTKAQAFSVQHPQA